MNNFQENNIFLPSSNWFYHFVEKHKHDTKQVEIHHLITLMLYIIIKCAYAYVCLFDISMLLRTCDLHIFTNASEKQKQHSHSTQHTLWLMACHSILSQHRQCLSWIWCKNDDVKSEKKYAHASFTLVHCAHALLYRSPKHIYIYKMFDGTQSVFGEKNANTNEISLLISRSCVLIWTTIIIELDTTIANNCCFFNNAHTQFVCWNYFIAFDELQFSIFIHHIRVRFRWLLSVFLLYFITARLFWCSHST